MIRPRAWQLVGLTSLVPLCAGVATSGCLARSSAVELYPELAERTGREMIDVDFGGGDPFGEDTLATIVQTRASRCVLLGLPFCVPFTNIGRDEHFLSPGVVADDVERLALFYRRAGYFGTSVRPEVEEEGDAVRVTFAIRRADPVTVDTLTIEGLDAAADPDSVTRGLPLQPGDIFHLGAFAASADTVLRMLQSRGHAYAAVLRNFTVDTATDLAAVTYQAIPGPRVVVDSIIVEGADNLGRGPTLRQLAFREGELLRRTELVESQRNLYNLEIVQFASVSVAPDSLQATPDDTTRATVLVRVAEAPVHQIDAAIGWGNVECFRAETRWENRSLGSGARSLTLSGSASKLGIGQGLGGSVCSAFQADTFANLVDYRVSADLTQPYLLSARNNLGLSIYAERQSQPLVFQREALGSRLAVTRRLYDRTFATTSVEVERGSTLASDVLFCGAFQVCDPDTIALLSGPRLRNSLNASLLTTRTDVPIDPARGYTARTGVTWAPSWLQSDVTFVRWTGDVALYTSARPRWVAAASVRFGNFFQTATPGQVGDFLPPQDRFYAGGATTVRGFDRNALGPGLYVTDDVVRDSVGDPLRDAAGNPIPEQGTERLVPTGGTSLLVLNGELRTPSPFLRDVLRLAWFVDAGSVTTRHLWDASVRDLKVTPGVGFRLQTPVGPVRLDVAYNPHRATLGPLYLADPETGELLRVQDAFRPEAPSFLGRLRVHLAVGQAF
jgi:outer membrane protein insertion porin family